jgi:hypothetical protein
LSLRPRISSPMSDQWNTHATVRRATVFAGLGRRDDARATATDAQARCLDLTIEDDISTSEWSDLERQRFIQTLWAAGFPACARPETLARFAKPIRLPECGPIEQGQQDLMKGVV